MGFGHLLDLKLDENIMYLLKTKVNRIKFIFTYIYCDYCLIIEGL